MEIAQVHKRLAQQEEMQKQIKDLKQILTDALMADDKYQQVDAEMRELATKKKRVKDDVWNLPDTRTIVEKLKDFQEDLKDTNEILYHELLAWRQENNNADEFPAADGSMRKVKISIKLAPKYEERN